MNSGFLILNRHKKYKDLTINKEQYQHLFEALVENHENFNCSIYSDINPD